MLNLARLHDFYLLEALDRDLRDTTLASPRAQQKLQQDVIEWKAHIEDVLAPAIYDYLLLASAGEARHASGDSAKTHYLEYFLGGDRGEAFERATDFDPIKLQKALETLFLRTRWGGGNIGGEKWGEIAKACSYYGKWPNGAFIDYCADLEHNNGTAFSKGEISTVADFSLTMEGTHINAFLTWKRNYDVLNEYRGFRYTLAHKTYRILTRWCVKKEVDIDTLPWKACEEPAQTDYEPVIWGTDTPVLIKKYKSGASIRTDENGQGINGMDFEQSLDDAHSRIYYSIQDLKKDMEELTLREMKEKVSEVSSFLNFEYVIDQSFKDYYKKDNLEEAKKNALHHMKAQVQQELNTYIHHAVCGRRTARLNKRRMDNAHDFTQEEIDLMGIDQAQKITVHQGEVYYSISSWTEYKTEKYLLRLLKKAKKKEVMPDDKVQEETDIPMWTATTYKWTIGSDSTSSISSKHYVDQIKTHIDTTGE